MATKGCETVFDSNGAGADYLPCQGAIALGVQIVYGLGFRVSKLRVTNFGAKEYTIGYMDPSKGKPLTLNPYSP